MWPSRVDHHSATDRRSRAFSLLETLVILSIIVFLLAMLIPGLSAAREQTRRVFCANNLRQWGAALLYYREDYSDFVPTEGSFLQQGIEEPGTWYNALPPYLGLPPYCEFDGANEAIRDLPNVHVWICPSKNLTGAYKSGSGKNQFHYGMNQVLDGLGAGTQGSRDTPGFPDEGSLPVHAPRYRERPSTVFLFDIAPNSPAGTPRSVANRYQRSYQGRPLGEFHGDFANLALLGGSVVSATAADLVADRDFRRGEIHWRSNRLYWGYPPPYDIRP